MVSARRRQNQDDHCEQIKVVKILEFSFKSYLLHQAIRNYQCFCNCYGDSCTRSFVQNVTQKKRHVAKNSSAFSLRLGGFK